MSRQLERKRVETPRRVKENIAYKLTLTGTVTAHKNSLIVLLLLFEMSDSNVSATVSLALDWQPFTSDKYV